MKTLQVTEKGFLLDYLFTHLTDLKKTKVRQILKYGSVRVNGRVATGHRHAIRPGDVIDFLSIKDAELLAMKRELKFKLIFEDSDILVTEKRAGLLTMGTDREKEKTLYFLVTAYEQAKSDDGRGRVFIVHRLDRDTSGFVVFAKNEAAKETLQSNWEKAVKKYYAIIEGIPKKPEGTLESYLVEDRFKRVYSVPKSTKDSKHAVTRYQVLETNSSYALLEIDLVTGRKNQIRVHLSDLGHPIAGDSKYGAATNPLGRLALHAGFLSIPHPVSGKVLSFGPKIPEVFTDLMREK
jgi:23S rRNA pseudouridine1911/1915/1917 synthase